MTRTLLPLLFVAAVGQTILAQSFVDLVDSRNAAQPYASVLQIEAGAIGARANGRTNPALGLDDEISWDGKVYYRDEAVGSRRGTLEAYAGRDGLFAGFTDGKLIGDDTVTRLEFRGRPWQFYRDGFYQGNDLRANGFYEGSDYEGYLGFGREANDGLYVEFGPFYKKLDFKRGNLNPDFGQFRIPEGYAAYGGRLYIEQRAVQMDRRRGLPRQGFVLTLIGEREWNNSRGPIGIDNQFSTELPSAVWRARGRLEWYVPASDSATWEIYVHGGWQDEGDRVQNAEGQRPLGHQWADGQLRLRFHLGDSFVVTPFANVQYSNVLKQDGFDSKQKFFLGGGVESYLHFSESLSMHGYYSFVDNPSRPSIRIDQDVHGEHMFYLGMVLRFGASRR